MKKLPRFSRSEISWMLYDWGNSIYATNIMAAIFPIYFTSVVGENTLGMQWWGYSTSFATLIVALIGPLLGSIADCRGMKKRLWQSFALLGAVTTLFMALTDQWQFMLVGYVLSFIGFEASCLFYDSMLTDVTTRERMNTVSAWGYAMGYFGGSTLGFIISIGILTVMGMDNPLAVKVVIVFTSIWWLLFSIPLYRTFEQTHCSQHTPTYIARNLFTHLGRTVKSILANRGVFLFMLAYFCYIDGVGTIINMATSYGTTLGLGSTGMILALLVTQIIAIPFSILAGRLARKWSAIRMIAVAIGMYSVIYLAGFYMGYSVETARGNPDALARAQVLFWIMATMVGTVQGGIQSLSRAQFGRMIPPKKSNEFFGFFGIFGKFATVVGPFLVAIVTQVTGYASLGILGLVVLFALGALFLYLGRNDFAESERLVHNNH